MVSLKNLTYTELERFVLERGWQRYRASQLAAWLYKHLPDSFDDFTNLPKGVRKWLGERFLLYSLEVVERQISTDGTQKFLFRTKDGNFVESVLIPDKDRLTLCISTQVGCRMGCRFCLTGNQGFKRNLSCAEIVDQILVVQKHIPERLTNIVIMGMGEPLDNYENTVKAISIITDPRCVALSYRRVTLSTVGLIPELERLLTRGPRVTLSISLNAPNPSKRAEIMPVERRHPIKRIISLLSRYCKRWRKPPTFEYVLLRGFNDSLEDAAELADLLKDIRCKINLIPFNPWEDSPFERPLEEDVLAFQEYLINRNFSVFIRKSRGRDILAACGQLRWKYQR